MEEEIEAEGVCRQTFDIRRVLMLSSS